MFSVKIYRARFFKTKCAIQCRPFSSLTFFEFKPNCPNGKLPALFGFSLKSVARDTLIAGIACFQTSMRNILRSLFDSLRTSYEFIRFFFIFVLRKGAEKSTSKLFSAYNTNVHFTSTVRLVGPHQRIAKATLRLQVSVYVPVEKNTCARRANNR